MTDPVTTQQRRTKIVATLGPASSSREKLTQLIRAGVDVVRLNFSHGTPENHAAAASLVRELAHECGRTVGVLADLQGPKIRIGKFGSGAITLHPGQSFTLDAQCRSGDDSVVGLDYAELPGDVHAGDELLLDDGRISMRVERVESSAIHCLVMNGGILSNHKGINRRGGGLTAPALTDKDRADIITAAQIEADYLAVSFVRSADDVALARELLRKAGGHAAIVAKIERTEAIAELDTILDEADAIMVARGDLAVEVGNAAVPAHQKRMIRAAREKHKLAITATQMMESMIDNPVPTRAEVSDVANAVIDGTDAVMLSAETAVGKYPVETVAMMASICEEAEREIPFGPEIKRGKATSREQSVARSAVFTANNLEVKAIAALTQSGMTAQLMSRLDTLAPIYALSPLAATRRKASLFRGVYPMDFSLPSHDPAEVLAEAEATLKRHGAVKDGDLIVLTIGEPIGKEGGTNTMKIVQVGEVRKP
ncbi:MAG TPA: pyruvate kinase [Noviherbaspirillum sp.]|uniref:pyruvate kinase n=1 Tax=Noviherbaspirillum sp. TaxID=1926288 RepID=UPI002B465C85|nr:pyruvate kinase [Noviherbaspirillum sp.]HJV85313.1 pyruvate kinase [Noviherbaspirillum sp.]